MPRAGSHASIFDGLSSYGLSSFGLSSFGLYSYDLYGHCPYSHGLCSYGLPVRLLPILTLCELVGDVGDYAAMNVCRPRRRHVYCADMGVLVLKMTALARRSF